MTDSLDELRNDIQSNQNKSGDRADYYKLKEGDNEIVILTNPVGYGELFNVGIAYEGCGYAEISSRKYKCYVKDLRDGGIKIMNLSYTVAKKLIALADGARTKFDGFPMPYSVNLKTLNAGKKEVETDILAGEDYAVSEEDLAELAKFDPISEILERLKVSQKKKVETDTALQGVIANKIEEVRKRREEGKNKDKNIATIQIDTGGVDYPEEDINLEDIPF